MKKSILLVSDELPHYRVPLFERLAERYRLTVAHGGSPRPGVGFQQHRIGLRSRAGLSFYSGLPDFNAFDVAIVPFNLRMASLYGPLLARRRCRLLLFGIGVSAAYDSPFDRQKKLDFLRRWWINRSDGAIFYEHYPLVKYLSQGVSDRKLFVAYNTVEPPDGFRFESRTFERFNFIGSLYRQKRIFEVLEAYRLLAERRGASTPPLDIIGDGHERPEIERWITSHGLGARVLLHGQVSDLDKLAPVLQRSIASISPGQAGLSVQRCFSFGVPYATTRTAITGGELFSIIHGVNGFLYDGSVPGLASLMDDLASRGTRIADVARNAWEYYARFRNPDIWLDGFVQAIEGRSG